MVLSSRRASPAAEGEEQTVTNWRLIWITGTLELLFLTVLLTAWRFQPGSHPKPEPATQQSLAVAKAEKPLLLPARPQASRAKSDSEKQLTMSSSKVKEERSATVNVSAPQSRPPTASQPAVVARAGSSKPQTNAARPAGPKSGSESSLPVVARQKIAVPLPPPAPELPRFKRLNHVDERTLTEILRQDVPEFDLDSVKGTSAKLLAQASKDSEKIQTVLDLLPGRPDLAQLPLRQGRDCQTQRQTARQLEEFSRCLRTALASLAKDQVPSTKSPGMRMVYFRNALHADEVVRKVLLDEAIVTDSSASRSTNLNDGAVSALVQLLQAEDEPLRQALVSFLSVVPTRAATVALAQGAVFDLAQAVREEALLALTWRTSDEIRQFLLDSLRHPWAPAADHAAEALVALQDKKAIPALVALLDQPNPMAPVQRDGKKWVVRELVRVNHLRNCLLCHSPSFSTSDLVRAPVPQPDQPLPKNVYYSRFKGDAIRADITYLRQDFSICQPVPAPGKWPELQRYDYLIRERVLAAAEVKDFQNFIRSSSGHRSEKPFAQRDAVLFALRELTGKDIGLSSQAWRESLAKRSP